MSDETKQSALEENISRKGTNSYYYAHGKKIDGPQWDGREEPRLLEVSTASVIEKKRLCVPLESFYWLDETKSVKIFVDFENAAEIPDDNVTLNLNSACLEFRVQKDEKNFALVVDPLNAGVASCSFRKKSDKFVLVLKKLEESSWSQLKKSSAA